jgi:hypothetical protein
MQAVEPDTGQVGQVRVWDMKKSRSVDARLLQESCQRPVQTPVMRHPSGSRNLRPGSSV